MSHVGRVWKSERATERDPVSGVAKVRLTNYLGHSHHLYFTNPGWWDGGRRLLFGSDRENASNLFSVELATGLLTQLTEFPRRENPDESFLFAAVNPQRAEAYFWHNRELVALDLSTLAQRRLYRAPDGFAVNMTNVTADGRFVCSVIYEDLARRFAVDLLHGFAGFAQYHAARPLSRVVEIAVDGAGDRVLFEEHYWIGHINTSPTRADWLTFCHEGPWAEVDNRIWGLNRATGNVWKIRPTEPGERVGHEYWLADGETIGFHGNTKLGHGQATFGFIGFDNSQHVEVPFPTDSHHFHSNTREWIVGDGPPDQTNVLLWHYDGREFSAPRALCRHRSSAHWQNTHVHPRFSPDGRHVVFTSDDSGYGQVYVVDVPAWDSLSAPVD